MVLVISLKLAYVMTTSLTRLSRSAA